jgi:hypothetical protein
VSGPCDKEGCFTRRAYLLEHSGEKNLWVGHLRPSFSFPHISRQCTIKGLNFSYEESKYLAFLLNLEN